MRYQIEILAWEMVIYKSFYQNFKITEYISHIAFLAIALSQVFYYFYHQVTQAISSYFSISFVGVQTFYFF